jgi:hypothetical protein
MFLPHDTPVDITGISASREMSFIGINISWSNFLWSFSCVGISIDFSSDFSHDCEGSDHQVMSFNK